MKSRNLIALFFCSLLVLGLVSSSFAQAAPPDRDGDGVADADDDCISDVGPASNNGCPLRETTRATDVPPPDSDGDGTADPLDRCPNEAGDGANGGCPAGSTGTGNQPAPTQAPVLAAAPTIGDCVVSTLGTNAVNIRQYPNLDAEVVGVISPNEWVLVLAVFKAENIIFSQNGMGDETPFHIFPFDSNPPDPNYPVWFLVQDSDSDATGWVAEAVLRLGGDCSEFVIENPNPDAAYLKIKLTDILISSLTAGGLNVAAGDVNGDGTVDSSDYQLWRANFGRSAVPVFPNENPFLWVGLDPQEASFDYFIKIDGVEGESEGDVPTEQLSLNFAKLEGNCELVVNSDGTISPVCDDGAQPESIIVCSYQQLSEAGVWEKVCYEVEIPDTCTIGSSNGGVWRISCDDDGDGVQVTPVGETDPILDITWGEGTVEIGLLVPAVQKVREAANR